MICTEYTQCRLCARSCGVDRGAGELGFCRMTDKIKVTRAAPHMWEEPIISGTRGSGTIFFSGCSLGCVYCQNREISRGERGVEITEERLADIMSELQEKGVHNINLVTPTHFVPDIRKAVAIARSQGLKLPIVYNTGTYDTAETICTLSDTVDIYLPDLKYFKDSTARTLSLAPSYPSVAREAIAQMVRQRPYPVIEDGIMKRGVIVRILLLPGHLAEAKLNLKHLYSTYGDSIYISLMNQYTPMSGMTGSLARRVTHAEYDELVEYADRLGIKNAFTQEWGTATESFIPPFDLTGVAR